MRNINVLGMVFPNQHDNDLPDLTGQRAFASVPFGGRYRLIDFVLSNMVNAGISKVGLVTKSHSQSLMDHVGSGKPWDLNRKNGGLYILPTNLSDHAYEGLVAALHDVRSFLTHSTEDYVLMADSRMLGNIDYAAIVERHIESGAEVTVAYKIGAAPTDSMLLTLEENRVTDIRFGGREEGAFGLGLYVIRRETLLQLTEEAYGHSRDSFERDILQRRLGELTVMGYEVPEYVAPIYSLATYFEANMALLDPEVRSKIFLPRRRIYTKVRDCAPAIYGLHSDVTDSLVADGAVIKGTVRRSVIFRDVIVDPGVVIENCVLMQGSQIRADAKLGYVICDKNVEVRTAASLQGVAHYPVYVKKGMKI